MAWRIVKQPNGLLARFSDIVDDFTHQNMTEAEALEICREYLGIVESEKKVLAGVQDWKPWTNGVLGSGLDRWNESIETIKSVHGQKTAEQRVQADSPRRDGMNKCEVCEEIIDGGDMCDDGVYRCVGCAIEDGFDIQTGNPV